MKKLLLFIMTMALSIATVQGQAKNRYKRQSTEGKFKYGLQGDWGGITSLSSTGFCEYEVTDNFGVRSGIAYDRKSFFVLGIGEHDRKTAFIRMRSVSVPIIARWYPGDRRQFCLFFGLQPRYLVGGTAQYRDLPEASSDNFEEMMNKGFDPEKLEDPVSLKEKDKHPTEISKMQLSFVVGFDHEFRSGVILGCKHGQNLTQIMKFDKSLMNWIFQLGLGYNFAKLID